MRPLTPEDYRDIWQRRKWWFLLAAFAIAAGTSLVAALLPSLYTSNCLILLQGQQVSSNYVKPLDDADVEQQLNSLIQETLSRTRLESIIREFGLAGPGVTNVTDQMIDNLRKQIQVQIIKDESPGRKSNPYAFKISFTTSEPKLAQRVDNELASFFVSQKLKTDERTAQDTLQFLQTQLTAAAKDLQDKEKALAQFKQQYSGQLPEDEQLDLQTLVRLQSQLQSVQQSLDRAQQEQAALATTPGPGTSESGNATASAPSKLEVDLQSLQAHLADLQSRYTPSHPDIIKTKAEIKRLQAEVANSKSASEAAASAKASQAASSPATSSKQQDNRALIASLLNQEKQLDNQVAQLQANLQAIPMRQQQYDQLQRAYNAAKSNFDEVQAKFQETQLASDVEARLQGQRFRIQDFASLPDTPSWPVRWKINLGGVGAGLFFGLLFAAGLELKDSTMKSNRDVEFYLRVKNLATVPDLKTQAELKRVRQRKILRVACGSAAVLLISGILGYLYFVRI